MNIVNNLINKKQIEQRSHLWYETRHNILTASSIASILDANPYLSKIDFLIQKCKPLVINDSNPAILWGIKYEPIASQIYQEMKDEKIYDIGLLIHDKHEWLGASPDGLRSSGKLLEIKCVWNRQITIEIPLYYWMQVQIQLEVTNLDECDLFQCKFIEYKNKDEYDKACIKKGYYQDGEKIIYWGLEKYSLNTIYRDRVWFSQVKEKLYNFWSDIMYYRNVGYEKILDNADEYQNISVRVTRNKRKLIDPNMNRKKQKTLHRYFSEDWSKWINATDVKNYILNDPILDWLNIYGDYHERDANGDFNCYVINKEIEFINYIIENNIIKNFSNEVSIIAHKNEKFSIEKYYQTIGEMIKGTPIIIQGLLHNKINNTYAIPNIIIRVDYLKKIIPIDFFQNDFSKKTDINYDYRVVNIKNISFELKDDNMIKNNPNVSIAKAEAIICNEALNPILGHIPQYVYLIGKKYKCDNIGVIDILNNDYYFINKVHDAINWLKELKDSGKNWNIMEPERKELYPNMSNTFDYPWHNFKKYLAMKNDEITLLWNCGVKERNLSHLHGIFSWKDINLDVIGFKNNKRLILNNILKVNKNKNRKIINDKIVKLEKSRLKFFVDFETINNNDDIIIYMIGIGWNHPKTGKWNFKNFLVNRVDFENEKIILFKWMDYMNDIKNYFNIYNVNVYHWSKAEVSISNKVFKRHNINEIIDWYDLLDFFKNNHIAIKGAFNYGLKTIAGALYENNYIKTKWEDNLDGISSMIVAIECENICKKNGGILGEVPQMTSIVKYNEIDCKVLSDIVAIF